MSIFGFILLWKDGVLVANRFVTLLMEEERGKSLPYDICCVG